MTLCTSLQQALSWVAATGPCESQDLRVNFLDDGSGGVAGAALAQVLKALPQALQQQVYVM